MFKKGQSGNPKGKPKGTKHDPRVTSLRMLLEDAFIRNHSAALKKIDQMFQGDDMNDFKFMLSLKASIEPKQVTGDFTFTAKSIMTIVQEAQEKSNRLIEYNEPVNG